MSPLGLGADMISKRDVTEKFAVTVGKLPAIRNVFPVNSLRELFERSLQHIGFFSEMGSERRKIANFPLKFPVTGNLLGDRCDQHCGPSQHLADEIRRFLNLPGFHSERPAGRRGRA